MEKEKLYIVKTPNPAFNGWRGHTHFTNGVGKATLKDAQRLVSFWGYSCEELEPPAEDAASKKPAKGKKSAAVGKATPPETPEAEPEAANQEPAAPEPETAEEMQAKTN